MDGTPCRESSKFRSSSFSSWEASNTASTRSAVWTRSLARFTPICSTRSSVERMPAVSESRRVTSPTKTVSSTTSRVVPGSSVTIDRSHPESRFIKVDFPTLGLPAITVFRPSRIALPASYWLSSLSRAASAFFSLTVSSISSTWGISSSG